MHCVKGLTRLSSTICVTEDLWIQGDSVVQWLRVRLECRAFWQCSNSRVKGMGFKLEVDLRNKSNRIDGKSVLIRETGEIKWYVCGHDTMGCPFLSFLTISCPLLSNSATALLQSVADSNASRMCSCWWCSPHCPATAHQRVKWLHPGITSPSVCPSCL